MLTDDVNVGLFLSHFERFLEIKGLASVDPRKIGSPILVEDF